MRLLLCVLLVFGGVRVECQCAANQYGKCDDGWTYSTNAGRCFAKDGIVGRTNAQARTHCRTGGAHLAYAPDIGGAFNTDGWNDIRSRLTWGQHGWVGVRR